MDSELIHYGVLGMKWGRKKTKTPSEDYTATKALRTKSAKELSDAELKRVISRMQLERQYKDLRASDISSGKKFVTGIMKDVGREMLKDYLKVGVKEGLKIATELLKEKK